MEKKEPYKFTGQDAENYDFYLGPIIFEPYAEYLASKIDAIHLSTMLELACGTGRVSRHIRKALPKEVEFYATDISSDMLTVARRKIGEDGINFSTEDIQNLSFPDNTFDLVICQFGMMFLPDKKKGLDEIYRVLKPGGKLMFFTWDSTVNIPPFKLLINELLLPYFTEEQPVRFFVPFSLHDPELLKDMMTGAGFNNINVDHVVLRSGTDSPKALVDALYRNHPLGKELMNQEPSAFEPVAKQFEEEAAKRFGATNPTFDLSAFLTSGEKIL